MWRDKEARRYMIGFVGAFLLFMMLRVATNRNVITPERPFFLYMISQIGCVLIVSCWMLTVQSRIIQPRARRLMLSIGGLFLLYFIMQMVKYCLFGDEPDVCRYMWYGYYVPMTFIPLLALYILQYLADPYGQRICKRWRLLMIPAVLICLGFLTNDLHALAFRIPDWYETGEDGRTLGPIYFLYIAFMAVLFLLGVYSTIRLRRSIIGKKKLVYPVIPLLIGILYLVLYTVTRAVVATFLHRFCVKFGKYRISDEKRLPTGQPLFCRMVNYTIKCNTLRK